jgi:hypothetical protein
MHLKKIAGEIKEQNRREQIIAIRGYTGSDFGFGLRYGLFFPAYKNFKIGFFADLTYRICFFSTGITDKSHSPRYIGGNLLFAFKLKGVYLGAGGFLHFRISDEFIPGEHTSKYVFIRPKDYGFVTSLGYIDTDGFKGFIGITFRYTPLLSVDKYYKSLGYKTLGRYSFNFEFGIGF